MNPTRYLELVQIHHIIKKIQQISFTSSQISKRYPIEKIDDKDIESVLKAYQQLVNEFNEILETTNPN